jgi:hypothetical protein
LAAATAGLAVTATNNAALCTATFTGVSVTPGASGPTDGPGRAGSSPVNATVWTILGGGSVGSSPGQPRLVRGSVTVSVPVPSVPITDDGARADVGFRGTPAYPAGPENPSDRVELPWGDGDDVVGDAALGTVQWAKLIR